MAVQDKRDKQKEESPPHEKGDPKVRSHPKERKKWEGGGGKQENSFILYMLLTAHYILLMDYAIYA